MNRFDGLYSLSDAADMLGIEDSVLRIAIRKNHFTDCEVRKFGKQWIITAEAIEKYRKNHLGTRSRKGE